MLIDKAGRKWESVQEWMDMCHSHSCDCCPISSRNNLYNLSCNVYVEEHPQEALERVIKAGILREEENNKEKEKIPPLCEVLRVQPYQEFTYKGIWYRITLHGERQAWYQSGQKWCWDSSCASLEEMIQERDKIQIGVQLTNEQKEELLRIKKMLPEAKKVFLTDDGVKVRMNSCDYKLNLDVVMPERLDYEFEEEEK